VTRPLDTNVIIRYLTNDHPVHSARAFALFESLERGTAVARLTEAVLDETVQVLSSRQLYDLPRAAIRRHLANIISLRGLTLPNKRRYLRALDLYVAIPAISFVDALLAVYAGESSEGAVVSFDAGFDRVPGIRRDEP
jgi:predicted nucleic acid-binding protein